MHQNKKTAIYNYGVGYIFNYASKGEDGKIIIVNQPHQPLLRGEGGKEKEDTPQPGREKCRAVREWSGKSRIPPSWKDHSSTDIECI